MATAKKAAAVALGCILGFAIMLPASVVGVHEVYQQYRHHQFLSSFFQHCAKGGPMVIDGVPYICMVGRLNPQQNQDSGENTDNSYKSRT